MSYQQNVRLAGLMRRYGWRMGFTYGLSLLGTLFYLSYPFAIGLGIDGVLAGRPVEVLWLVSLWLLHILVDVTRQVIDTRSFARLHADIAAVLVFGQRTSGASTSHMVARAGMARELTQFLENDVPQLMRMAISPAICVAALFAYDFMAGVGSLALMGVIVFGSVFVYRRSMPLNASLNDELEREAAVIENAHLPDVRAHYDAVAGWRIRLSDLNARAWSMNELVMVGFMSFAILRFASMPGAEVGMIYASIGYVWRLFDSLYAVPYYIQLLPRLSDIRKRIGQLEEEQA